MLCKGQVQQFHQTLFRIIGKLAANKKAKWVSGDWLFTALVEVWEAPLPPCGFLLPNHGHPYKPLIESPCMEVRKNFKEAYTEAQHQSNCKTNWQKWYYDRATSTVQLMPGNIVLMKADTFQGKRKVKDQWSEVDYIVVCQVADDVPMYEVQNDGRNIKIIHCNQLFLVATL